VAAVHRESSTPAWRAEYVEFSAVAGSSGLPRTVRLASVGSNRFDLRLILSQVEINARLDDGAFTIQVPATATPITLPELRTAGPLGR
jgi:outer membrane lipoprotein-sorting protein